VFVPSLRERVQATFSTTCRSLLTVTSRISGLPVTLSDVMRTGTALITGRTSRVSLKIQAGSYVFIDDATDRLKGVKFRLWH